jgi:hypothetical protein
MQLRTARLCLDCEEVHDEQRCPSCASETFTFITRWVPAPERRNRTRPTTSPEAELYKNLLNPDANPSMARRLLKPGMVGLTALGIAGLFLGRKAVSRGNEPKRPTRSDDRDDE